MTAIEAAPESAPRRRWIVFLPLVGFCALAGLFLVRLYAGDPARLPSALIGHAVPGFSLDSVPGLDSPGLHSTDLASGHVSLVNVFASWCPECHVEHDALLGLAADPTLKARGVTLQGIAYRDRAEDTRRFLGAKGNPYAAVGNDASGRTGIDLGVYGVPETFVVKGDGTIAYKLVGPVTAESVGTLRSAIDDASR